MLEVKLLNLDAVIPSKGSDMAAGLDLSCIEDKVLQPGERHLFKTGLAIQPTMPNVYLRIAPRSGLAYKHGIDTLAGVVDADYEGDVGVILVNTGTEPVEFTAGDRIAQLIPEVYVHDVDITLVTELTNARGGGFGSTGK